MTTFCLVHGGWHGAWSWSAVVERLRRRGFDAIAVDLPADDPESGTAEYAAAVVAALEGVDDDVVLVGHSLGGLSIPLVPALRPVRELVFVASLLPKPGFSWREQVAQDHPMSEAWMTKFLPNRIDVGGASKWPPDIALELLYGDCPPEEGRQAVARMRAQADKPVVEKTPLDDFPNVPIRYARCLEDTALNAGWSTTVPALRLGVEVDELPGGHMVGCAHPDALVDYLLTPAWIQPAVASKGTAR